MAEAYNYALAGPLAEPLELNGPLEDPGMRDTGPTGTEMSSADDTLPDPTETAVVEALRR